VTQHAARDKNLRGLRKNKKRWENHSDTFKKCAKK